MKPKLSAVAREASVSITTASLVLRGRATRSIPPATRERVMNAATKLGYPFEQIKTQAKFSTIGLYCSDLRTESETGNEWLAEHSLLLAAAYAAGTRNQKLVLLKPWHLQKIEPLITEEGVTGCLILRKDERDQLSPLTRLVPTVDLTPGTSTYQVLPNTDKAAEMVRSHFSRLGHSRVCFVGAGRIDESNRQIIESFRLLSQKLEVGPSIVANAEEASRLVDSKVPPTAFWCADDETARQLWVHLDRKGLHVPKNVSIVGSGNTPLAACPDLGLTSLSPNWDTMIHTGLDLLEGLSQGRQVTKKHLIDPRLVLRTSTGPAL